MASTYKTPGVYVEEVSIFPPSVAEVETAIPAFIGYTEKAKRREDGDLFNVPHRITSLKEYELHFGFAVKEADIAVTIDTTTTPENVLASIGNRSNYLMYYSLRMFFANGGGPCWIVAVDSYANGGEVVDSGVLQTGLAEVAKIDEVTLLVFPDSTNIQSGGDYYSLHGAALDQCVELQDRFTVLDIWIDPADPTADNI
ncbi:MAG: phage tail protein, partial [Lewinella sp.]